ncbi:G2/mitotic-specific cyclin S13-7-like isoform X3 [Lycium barbarum]|uniref:G2/mitotic-specific cyclin S13-7-like isoform X3 n=1 Tax=Lycium barbarum TaxID=112863 RepID=UPI00293F4BF2|nr:G2/mitotic-specific cyclin S13-7-like isoform X3 [Lycium barbarum]
MLSTMSMIMDISCPLYTSQQQMMLHQFHQFCMKYSSSSSEQNIRKARNGKRELSSFHAFYHDDYVDSQPKISARVRVILVNWLVEAHKRFELRLESLYLTVNIMDGFLSEVTVLRKEFAYFVSAQCLLPASE